MVPEFTDRKISDQHSGKIFFAEIIFPVAVPGSKTFRHSDRCKKRKNRIAYKAAVHPAFHGETDMKLFGRILIATDGSEKNKAAVKKGLEIARACGSALVVIYVIDETLFTSAQAELVPESLYSQLKGEGEKAVAQVKQMAGELPLETVVLSGKPAQVITDFAVKNTIDLIVIGSRSKSGFERFFMGSVAESVIHTADCMVLLVKG